uniref:Uncharacterized protein n=1 Tax=Cacopsylla melanoneura TaxID=428564 RepID=A0A8D8Z5K1_9HEMI
MDSEDRDSITKNQQDLESKTTRIGFDSAKQLTIIKNVNAVTLNNSENIDKIISHIGQYDKILGSIYNQTYKNFNLTLVEIENYIQGLLSLKNAESYIDAARINLSNFKEGLNMLFVGKITPDILPEKTFFKILSALETKLNNTLYLPYPVTQNKLFHFYSVTKSNIVPINNKLVLILEIPLFEDNSNYNLFEISTLPLFHPELNTFLVETSVPNFIAVNTDHSKYFLLSKNTLDGCDRLIESSIICQEHVIRFISNTTTNCIWEQFNKNSSKNCNINIIHSEFGIYLQPLNQDVVYSTTPTGSNLTIQCPIFVNTNLGPKLNIHNSSIMVTNAGKIENAKGCKIFSEKFELEVESDFITNYKLTIPSIIPINMDIHFQNYNNESMKTMLLDPLVKDQ